MSDSELIGHCPHCESTDWALATEDTIGGQYICFNCYTHFNTPKQPTNE